MRFFIDTEFSERGSEYPIELISVGIVAENGNEFYAVAHHDTKSCNDWVKINVLPNLYKLSNMNATGGGNPGKTFFIGMPQSRSVIAKQIEYFINDQLGLLTKPDFWGYYCDYDWVILCQLFGTMKQLPPTWPKYCLDVKQLAVSKGNPQLPEQKNDIHNALEDARWTKEAYDFLMALK